MCEQNTNKQPAKMLGFQCPHTSVCQNKLCLWYQRDRLGRPLILNGWTEEELSKFGYGYFPTMFVYTGTNEIGVWCDEFINEDWNGHTYELKDKQAIAYASVPDIKLSSSNKEVTL